MVLNKVCMKKGLFVFLLMGLFQFGHAQTFEEWTQQKKKQIEYLVQQIVALQVYIGYVQKGYKIVDQGLTTIGQIKNGDFNLHRDFFDALKEVNPRIRNSAQVADIIALQVSIIQTQKKNIERVKKSDQLTIKEQDYIIRVYMRLLEQTTDNIEELTKLLTANNYTLSDDERIKRIGLLHTDMQDKYGFVKWFADQTNMLIGGRKNEQRDAGIGKSLLIKK
jgi:hypothetical protein